MKRKQFLSLLLALCMAASLLAIPGFAQGRFADVAADAYYAEAVNWAVEKAVTAGTSAATFSPDDTCTRAQMVTFLWRTAGSPAPAHSGSAFMDVARGSYYEKAVIWAAENNITSGTAPFTFSPNNTVTRAEAVTFLWRLAGEARLVKTMPFTDVNNLAFYTNAVLWALQQGITSGTTATTFSPDDPCTRAQIVTFLHRYSQTPAPADEQLKTNYPVILVHGLLGWGSYDDLNPYIPYWGMTCADVVKHLRSCGADVYAASVGPISSAWDRACELYAQLSGTVTDYGAAHAKLHGHDRFGRDYTGAGQFKKLIPGPWDAQHPVNLVGHSFGGATTRLMLDLLSDGNAEEQAYMKAHPEEGTISPLFTGGKADWVYSLTALAAPSNGTTFIESNHGFTDLVEDLTRALSRILGPTPFKGIYDFQLEHFGLQPVPGDDLETAMARIQNSTFQDHHDSAYMDLTIDRSMFINQDIQMQPGVYYFSYYGNRTDYHADTDTYTTGYKMEELATPFSSNMCKYLNTTDGSFVRGYGDESYTVTMPKTTCGKEWQPNDGLVNVVSGRWPYHFVNGAIVEDAHTQVSAPVVKATQKGVWYVMPELDFDHLTFMGGIYNEDGRTVNAFYHDVLHNIINCGG